MTEAKGLNDFQRKLSLDKIYPKNESQSLNNIESYNQLKILTWNIERGHKPEALASYINQVNPDVVCLQEVDWNNQRTNNEDVLDIIARLTSMVGVFGVEFLEIETPDRLKKLAGGGVQGNAILTRIQPQRSFRIELPVAFDWTNPRLSKQKIGRREKRVGARFALCLEFNYFGRPIVISTTHLEDKDGGVAGRFKQFQCLAQRIRAITPDNAISVIAGDFNSLENWLTGATRTYQTSTSLKKPRFHSECRWWQQHLLPQTGYVDPFTCNDWTYQKFMVYREKLDWISARNCRVRQHGIGDFNSSDHRPLWVQIALESIDKRK